MKLLKKWLFPVLTCLIVAGAAVLPARVSQARDARQFGQVHTEELKADVLPVYEPPGLGDRMELYAHRLSIDHPVLSFEDPFYFEQYPQEREELMQSMEALLTEAGLIPKWVFQEEPFTDLTIKRCLLWDPAEDSAVQRPAAFYVFKWACYEKLHNKLLTVDVDAETGLPIEVYIFDTNISQWLPYEVEPLQALVGRFFDLLGMDVQEVDTDQPYEVWRDFYYDVNGLPVRYAVSRHPTSVSIQLDLNWHGSGASSATDVYDG